MFTLNRKQVRDFAFKHQNAMLFFMWAANDYAAARCCILNGLGTGLRLASEAIEKLLKAAIWLETGSKPNSIRADLHNPFLLKEELKITKDYQLDRHDVQLRKLNDHYLGRYHDNPVTGAGASSDELPEIDTIWITIIMALPIPKEVLIRSAFVAELFEERHSLDSKRKWLTINNSAIVPTLQALEPEYKEFQKYYESYFKSSKPISSVAKT